MVERKAVLSCVTAGNCLYGWYRPAVPCQSVTTRTSCRGPCTNTLTDVSRRVTVIFDRPMPPKSRLIFVLPTRSHSGCISELLKDRAQERCWPSRTLNRRDERCCVLFHTRLCSLNTLQPSGHYMYRQFNIQQLYVLSTQCIYVFCVDLRTNSDYFTVQR